MGRGGWMRHERLYISEIVGNVDDFERSEHFKCPLLAAFDFERDHGSPRLHLTTAQVSLGMAWQMGIENVLHTGHVLQSIRDIEGCGRLLDHAQFECFETLEQNPGIEG